MILAFVLLAGALTAVAAVLLVRPLLKRRDDARPDAVTAGVVLFVLFALGGGAYVLLSQYAWVEAPAVADTPAANAAKLARQLAGEPDNLAYFWLTGALSSFLDNAPTYLVFFELAGGDPQALMTTLATTLVAISAGAVFMGANTYIGNAPNFMVYAIARQQGVRMPAFFGYMLWSGAILIPTYVLTGWLFF
jgi:Na+/H+ antiporter NhaD/arsenite permease-like protein